MPPIPVIDLFAGPGGLSEGFSRHGEQDWSRVLSAVLSDAPVPAFRKTRFQVAVSVEMDAFAHQTLELRALVRKLRQAGRLRLFERYLQDFDRTALFEQAGAAGEEARDEAWCARLGDKDTEAALDERVKSSVSSDEPWVLIGGPPCQAYSLAGRSRNRGKTDYRPENDERHFLYREYLRIVARHRPPVFVMENVKGLLSSKVGGESMFERIEEDLRSPVIAIGGKDKKLRYALYPVVAPSAGGQLSIGSDVLRTDYVVKMETRGIPQARHRIILLGVREDVACKPSVLLPLRDAVAVGDVLSGLPSLRSGLSKAEDSPVAWTQAVVSAERTRWWKSVPEDVKGRMKNALHELASAKMESRGAAVSGGGGKVPYAPEWYQPDGFRKVLNHETRSHIEGDLHRYLFASAWGDVLGYSPNLSEFPRGLLPEHSNAQRAIDEGGLFGDRFRVQVASKPSTTVTSHISKDGHYYIHPDPAQCRSLSVREAARLQTFPDDYFFCGARTAQYHQVGNAVPPLLATQIASVVAGLLD